MWFRLYRDVESQPRPFDERINSHISIDERRIFSQQIYLNFQLRQTPSPFSFQLIFITQRASKGINHQPYVGTACVGCEYLYRLLIHDTLAVLLERLLICAASDSQLTSNQNQRRCNEHSSPLIF